MTLKYTLTKMLSGGTLTLIDKLLRMTTDPDKLPARSLQTARALAKETSLLVEEGDEMLRDVTAQEDIIANDTTDHDLGKPDKKYKPEPPTEIKINVQRLVLLVPTNKMELAWRRRQAKEETYETEGDVPEEDVTADDATVHHLLLCL